MGLVIMPHNLLAEVGSRLAKDGWALPRRTALRASYRRRWRSRPDGAEADALLAAARREERWRLRRELHDVVGPSMCTATMRGEVARQLAEDHPAVAAVLGQLLDDLQVAVTDVRRLARDCAADEVGADDGLTDALRREASRFEQASGGRLRVRVDGPDHHRPIPPAVDLAVRRVVAEALTNIAWHARARHCSIRLGLQDERTLGLDIRDDGIGIPTEVKAGLGLASIADRVSELDGVLRIQPNWPTGTHVLVRLPLTSV